MRTILGTPPFVVPLILINDFLSPSIAKVFGTDDENDIRDIFETLRKRMTEFQTKKGSPKHPERQPPGSVGRSGSERASEGSDREIVGQMVPPRNASAVSLDSSASSHNTPETSTSSSFAGSDRESGPRRLRKSRAMRALRAFTVSARKRTERQSVFKKDSTSATFEAYLIYSHSADSTPPPLMKLPFGHRRLTQEVKRALRKHNPWDVLLVLSPQDRVLVDRVVQQLQLAANGSMNVCLVAIDIGRDNEIDRSCFTLGELSLLWTKMVLFFRYEPVDVKKGKADTGADVIGPRSRFSATIRRISLGSQRANRERLEVQERLKREQAEKIRQEAKSKADREDMERGKAELEKAREILETEKIRIEQEMNVLDSRTRALKHAEEAVLKGIEKGAAEQDLKKLFEEEREKLIEEVRPKEAAKKAAGEDKEPIKFKDAIGRKFTFPFNLVSTWQVSLRRLI